MLLAATAPAWGGEVTAPYPQLFPGAAQNVAGSVETTPVGKTDETPRHQAGKAAGASANLAGFNVGKLRPDVVGAILGMVAFGAIVVVSLKGLNTEN
ncbi:MAG: hypothetical protein CMM08_14695 [Rhodospirillaceae bacterium]|jgi:hypothetical protein|nr:hypothetical protein [Rhodospirillaceae bacterium]|tara:strand:+ start:869 stop:1159 length:291 start_codon:yes stop_codon:yes gene_type:complete